MGMRVVSLSDLITTPTAPTLAPLYMPDGTVLLPGLAFINDLDTGIYRIGTNNLGVSAGGTKYIEVDHPNTQIILSAGGNSYLFDGAGANFDGDLDVDGSVSATDNVVLTNGYLDVKQITKPTAPAAGRFLLYGKTDGFYYLDENDVEKKVGSGGTASINFRIGDSGGPLESNANKIPVLLFDAESLHEIIGVFKVPEAYLPGTQIKLVGGAYACSAVSGNVLFRAITTLLEHGSTILGTHANQHTSTNAEQTVPGTTNQMQEISDIDLTDSSGQINGQAVAPGDHLYVLLYRDNTNESSPAAADAKLVRDSFEVQSS